MVAFPKPLPSTEWRRGMAAVSSLRSEGVRLNSGVGFASGGGAEPAEHFLRGLPLLLALIHPPSGKIKSPKSICRMLDKAA